MKILLNLMSENPFASIFFPFLKGNSKMDVADYYLSGKQTFSSEANEEDELYLISGNDSIN